MNGVEVLNFTLREEPGAVRELLRLGGVTAEQVDDFVFHQANRFIVQNLALRLKLPLSKVPCGTVKRFGNQSSASIPAVVCHELADKLATGPRRIVASGFGVALSWASCLLWLDGLKVCHLTPYRVIDTQITSPAVP
jgi:3-oxoacyl-[acyl-carrier-protein] synthase-3